MNKLLYEGKAKQIFEGDTHGTVLMFFKDDAKAYGGIKKAIIKNKGKINNNISSLIFEYLNSCGVKTHFIKKVDESTQLLRKVKVFPLEIVARNVASGSLCSRFNIDEGVEFSREIIEYSYKCDDNYDPIINFDIAENLKIATRETLKYMDITAREINRLLKAHFKKQNIKLVDFKMEFGVTEEGEVLLCDEISPDTARLWDSDSNEKLDKDRFRHDLGKIEEAYFEILKRLQ